MVPTSIRDSLSQLFLLPLLLLTTTSWALYDSSPGVAVFDSISTFESKVIQDPTRLWGVQLYNPDDDLCQRFEKFYTSMTEMFHGIVSFGVVDVSSEDGLAIVEKYLVKADLNEVPSVYYFLDDVTRPQRMNIDMTSDESVLQSFFSSTSNTMVGIISKRAQDLGLETNTQPNKQKKQKRKGGSTVVTISGEAEFQQKVLDSPEVSLIAFTAPWCGHCQSLKPEFEEAADQLQGQAALLGWIDATLPENEGLARDLKVEGFPTIIMFPGGANKSKSDGSPYHAERKAGVIAQYILKEIDATGVPKDIPQITSRDVLLEECQGKNHLCVIAALPHIVDSGAEGRNKYKELVQKVAKSFRAGAFSFVWFEGGEQPALEQALELTFGFPALVAYSLDRQAFAVLHGSFSEKGMSSFLHGITSGRVPTRRLSDANVPEIVTIELWDGLDAAPPEEEFDLADIMGSDDDDEGEKKEEL